MNPICPNCYKPGKPGEMNDTAVLLVTRSFSTVIETTQSILSRLRKALTIKEVMARGGRSKYWYCTRCKRRWKKGGEIIEKKL